MKRIVLLLLAVFASSSAVSADGVWKHYANGSDHQDIAVWKNDVWCAASGSLVRWDSSTGKYTQFTRQNHLPTNSFLQVEPDGMGGIWTLHKLDGAHMRIGSFEGREWNAVDTTDGPGEKADIRKLYTDHSGALWVGTSGDGLFRYDRASWKKFFPESVVDISRTAVADRDGVLWFATPTDGAFSFDGKNWRHYTPADGLADTVVRCIAVGPDGAKWFGTSRGISRFDGASWRTFTVKDNLASNTVNAVTFDASGQVWVATDLGVSRYDGVSWKSWKEADNLISKKVTGLAADHSGRIWLAHRTSENGVTVIENGEVVWYTTYNSGLPSNVVRSVACDARGVLWFALDAGVVSFDGREWKTWTTTDGLKSNNVSEIIVDAKDRKWFLSSDSIGATCFDGSTWRTWSTADGLPSDLVYSVVALNGDTWFTTSRGVARFDGSSWTRFPNNDRLVSDIVSDIAEDAEGVMWFATDVGLTRYDGVAWRSWTINDGIPYGGVRAVRSGPGGILWLLYGDGRLCRFDGSTFQVCPLPEGSRGIINCIAVDEDGVVWTDVGTRNSLYKRLKYAGTAWEAFDLPAGRSIYQNYEIHSIDAGEDSAMWYATDQGLMRLTASGGTLFKVNAPQFSAAENMVADLDNVFWISGGISQVLSYDGANWKVISTDFGGGEIKVDAENTKWMYQFGLYRLDGEAWKPEVNIEDFPFIDKRESGFSIPGTEFTIDDAGRKWFAVSNKSLYCFDDGKWKSYPRSDGLPFDNVSGISVDREGFVWVATTRGAFKLTGESLAFRVPGQITCMEVRNGNVKWFGTSEGLIRYENEAAESVEIVSIPSIRYIYSVAMDYAGVLWVGTGQGVFRFDGNSWKRYTIDDGLYENLVYEIVVDRNNVKWFANGNGLTALDDRAAFTPGVEPKELLLRGNYPNPFNAGTVISFDLFSHGSAEVDIYNLIGQKVRTIRAMQLTAGRNTVPWDGRNDRGAKLSSGPYFYQVRKGGEKVNGRMLLVK